MNAPPKNTYLMENSNLFDPSFFPFIYLPVSCHSTVSDVVVPKIGEAIEEKCFEKNIQTNNRIAGIGNTVKDTDHISELKSV